MSDFTNQNEVNERTRSSLVDLNIYTREAVLKSAHRFTGVCFVELKEAGNTQIEIRLLPKNDTESPDKLLGEFLNDLLDQRLRTLVADETAVTRDLIMAYALSRAAFVRPDLESAEPLTDPQQIAAPVYVARVAK